MCQTISGIRENARVEGKVEGIKVGETLILTLVQKLSAEGRGGEVQKESGNVEHRKRYCSDVV